MVEDVLDGQGELTQTAGGRPGMRRRRPRPPRSRASRQRQIRATVAVAMLALSLVLVGVLAYKAQSAMRSHRATAERTLREYAGFAAWEFAQHARMSLLTADIAAFVVPVSRVDPSAPPSAQPTPAEVATLARERAAFCQCLERARFFFRYDWRDSSFVTAGQEPSPAVRRWVRDTILAHVRLFERPSGFTPLPYGTADGSPMRRLGVIVTNDSYVNVFDQIDGEHRVVTYVLSRDARGEPVATYGFESDATDFVGPLFERITEREALLPPSLISGMPADSILAVTVSDRQGRPVYRSHATFPATFVGIDTLERGSGGLVVQVALRPQMASRLVVGGLPRSQLPLLVGLFLLTCGLVAVALHQIRRQQELARLRTDFVSGVSHELRTPLAQIRLFAELLHTGALRSEEEREHSARVVDQEARRLTYLVENVLSFSRGDRRANRVSLEQTDIEEELSNALEMFEPVAAARGVELRAELEPGVVAPVDKAALRQVVLNLLDNAVKYGPEGQTVSMGCALAATGLRIWVEDEGRGIPAEERDRVFEPYHRLERDANSAVGGSGIGLAVVRELVELHGGRVWVEDALGGGARVVLELPAGDAARDERTEATPVTGGVA